MDRYLLGDNLWREKDWKQGWSKHSHNEYRDYHSSSGLRPSPATMRLFSRQSNQSRRKSPKTLAVGLPQQSPSRLPQSEVQSWHAFLFTKLPVSFLVLFMSGYQELPGICEVSNVKDRDQRKEVKLRETDTTQGEDSYTYKQTRDKTS